MNRPCEVCSGMLVSGVAPLASGGRVRRILLEGRVVALCEEHARLVAEHRVVSVPGLQGLFTEASGRRSHVDRRSPLDRRLFPPRPEGRRRNMGRRTVDP